MSLDAHLAQLQKKHAVLAAQVEDEQRRPAGDDLALARLKREKLHLKDEIVRLSPR
ncbi:MAG: DUF465 domain-containing protein [Pseudomonadota bacterium]